MYSSRVCTFVYETSIGKKCKLWFISWYYSLRCGLWHYSVAPLRVGLFTREQTSTLFGAKNYLKGSIFVLREPMISWLPYAVLVVNLVGPAEQDKRQWSYFVDGPHLPRHNDVSRLLWHFLRTSFVRRKSAAPLTLLLLVHDHLCAGHYPILFRANHQNGGHSPKWNKGTRWVSCISATGGNDSRVVITSPIRQMKSNLQFSRVLHLLITNHVSAIFQSFDNINAAKPRKRHNQLKSLLPSFTWQLIIWPLTSHCFSPVPSLPSKPLREAIVKTRAGFCEWEMNWVDRKQHILTGFFLITCSGKTWLRLINIIFHQIMENDTQNRLKLYLNVFSTCIRCSCANLRDTKPG